MGDSLAASVAGTADQTAVAPSWLHRAVAFVERLPWPAPLSYVGLFLAGALFWHLVPWSQGKVPVGTIQPTSCYWGFLLPALLWITSYLQRGAAASFESFRPILLLEPDAAARLRRQLTTIPARPALLITGLAAAITGVSVVSDPSTYSIGVPLPIVVGEFLFQSLFAAALFQLLYLLIRQTTLVRRTLATAVTIDIFRPAPLHAFAAVTARPGIVISLLVGVGVLIVSPASSVQEFIVNEAPYIVVPPLVAVFAFVLPLMGTHERLSDQKERLRADAELRLEALLGELNLDVDARDVTRAAGVHSLLSGLLLQRDVLAKLPTWPWSATTIRGLVSAILLPIALFLVEQAVSRFI
jgi:hypothetical protein